MLSKPLYESLPWLYGLAGVFALAVGYRLQSGWWSHLATIAGIAAITFAIVVGLRRRDYRAWRARYTNLENSIEERRSDPP